MKPTDILGNIKLYNADNMEVMKTFKDKQFSLAIIDPPYGININHNIGRRKGDTPSNYKKVEWDIKPPSKDFFNELFRISENQIIWGANHFISNMPFDSSCWLMWDKKFSEEVSFAQFELAWTSFKSTCKKFELSPLQQKRIHPTQKPVELYRWLLTNYAKEGDTILDTHFGSLSIGIACHDLKFDLTAIELDKDYYEQSKQRLINHQRQLTLFRHITRINLQSINTKQCYLL